MTTTRKIHTTIIVCLAVLSALFLAELIIVSISHDNRKRELENLYRSAMYDLTDSVDNLQVNTSKLMVSGGTEDSRELLMDTYRHAECAAQSVSRLPIDYDATSDAIAFFNQVGDWCVSYGNAIEEKREVTAFKNQADEIFDTTTILAEKLREIDQKIAENGIYSSIGKDRILPVDFNNLMGNTRHGSVNYPELIYDGPFSSDKTYHFHALDGLDEITEDDAKAIAKKLGVTTEEIYKTHGKTDEYYIHGTKNGKEAFLSLSARGGLPMLYDLNRNSGAVKLSRSECEKRAEEFATTLGFENMTAVWFNMSEGVAVVNLAPKMGGVICYTDLMKVKVASDDGEIIGFECEGYCLNCKKRSLSPTIDEGTARALVSPKIRVKSVRLALIPIKESEALCYEVAGEYRGLDYFVYIDALKGRELSVLRVVDNDQGSLTM